MIPLSTDRLLLRNWREEDQPAMHRLNSDELVMKYFPVHRNRTESNQLMNKIKDSIDELGFGFGVVELINTGEVIGFAGLSRFHADVPFAPAIEIGWRFLPQAWGKGYATEAANKWLDYGFNSLALNEIVSFAVKQNTASTAVMRRIGMRHYPERDFDHPNVSDEHRHLKRHVYYSINKTRFVTRQSD